VRILKKQKMELELRLKDQEEELDDLAGQVSTVVILFKMRQIRINESRVAYFDLFRIWIQILLQYIF